MSAAKAVGFCGCPASEGLALPELPRTPAHRREGAGCGDPRSLRPRRLDARRRRSGEGHGRGRHVQERRQQALRRDRRAGPREHWPQIASTNPLERVNREIKRRADVIGIFPNDDAIVRLVGALMLETKDEWAVARRYMSLETLARVTNNPTFRLPAVAA